MKRTERIYWKNFSVASVLLFCLVGCSMDFGKTNRFSQEKVKTIVSQVIDEEMDTIKDNLEPELQAGIENGVEKSGVKGLTGQLSGREIVDLISTEDYGDECIDFCFSVQQSSSSLSTADVLEAAQNIVPEEEFQELREMITLTEKRLEEVGDELVKGIPADQQEAFYKDLKVLVVRSVVLLTAGIVYAVMPTTVFWGKVSAAAAISIGAGMVAIGVMTIYQYFKFGPSEEGAAKTFEEWFKEILEDSKAEFALTTAITAMGTSLGKGPVVTGIIMCAYAVFKAVDLIRVMLKTYDFNA